MITHNFYVRIYFVFYTSVSAVVRNMERQVSVVLAASPALKKDLESKQDRDYLRYLKIQEYTL